MEVMDISLDKFYKPLYKDGQNIPEDILGKIAEAVSELFNKSYSVRIN
jgi:hypothetical protein